MRFVYVLLYFALSAISTSVSDPGAESGYVPNDARIVVIGGTNQDHRDKKYSKSQIVIAHGSNGRPVRTNLAGLELIEGRTYNVNSRLNLVSHNCDSTDFRNLTVYYRVYRRIPTALSAFSTSVPSWIPR